MDPYIGRKDTLNTFYLQLYGIRHMVKDHSDSEKGNPLPPPRLLFPISSKGSFICIIPDRITHTMAFVTPVVDHWLEWDIAQWVQDRSDHLPYHVDIYHWAMSRTSLNCALYWDMIFDYFLSNILSTLPCAEIWFPYYYNYYSVLHKTTQQTCVCVSWTRTECIIYVNLVHFMHK